MVIGFKGRREKAYLMAEPRRVFMEKAAFKLGFELLILSM